MRRPSTRPGLPFRGAGFPAMAFPIGLIAGLLTACTLVSPSVPPPKAVSTPLDPMLRTRSAAAEAAAAADAARRRSEAAVQQALQ